MPPEQAPGPEAGRTCQRREARSRRADTNQEVQTWYGGATETIASRMGIRSRSTLIVEMKEGNSTPEDPLDRGEVPGHGAEDGKHKRETELE